MTTQLSKIKTTITTIYVHRTHIPVFNKIILDTYSHSLFCDITGRAYKDIFMIYNKKQSQFKILNEEILLKNSGSTINILLFITGGPY